MSIDYRLRVGTDMPTTASELPALQDAASDANVALANSSMTDILHLLGITEEDIHDALACKSPI
jgi:hypothetical protein